MVSIWMRVHDGIGMVSDLRSRRRMVGGNGMNAFRRAQASTSGLLSWGVPARPDPANLLSPNGLIVCTYETLRTNASSRRPNRPSP